MFELSDREFEAIRRYVFQQAGWVLDKDAKSLLEMRLDRYRHGVPDLGDISVLLDALTIQETYFFREEKTFSALSAIFNSRTGGRLPLQILSAACSTGQEPYSIGITALEAGIPASITGLDISPSALERAVSALYSEQEVKRGISPELLEKYFERQDRAWRLAPSVRRLATFGHHNLLNPLPRHLQNLDLIFCRNVFIYFGEDTRKQAVFHLISRLKPGGLLALSATENLWGMTPWLRPVLINGVTFYERSEESLPGE